MNIKRLAVGFGFFFLSYVIASLIDAKVGVTRRLVAMLPGNK